MIGPTQFHSVGEVRNGTLRSADAAPQTMIVPYLETATFDNVTLDNVNLLLDGAVTIRSGLHGTGEIQFRYPEAIEGLGTVVLDVVEPGITIRGGLFVPTTAAKIVLSRNEGRVRAESNAFFGEGYLQLSGSTITNAGSIEVAKFGTLIVGDFHPPFFAGPSDASLSFVDDGRFVVDGGGLLAITGDLDLSLSALDRLIVLPKADGSAYVDATIITYSRTLSGLFDSVTPGITVTYGNGFIAINGTPTPEPGILLSICGAIALCARRRRH